MWLFVIFQPSDSKTHGTETVNLPLVLIFGTCSQRANPSSGKEVSVSSSGGSSTAQFDLGDTDLVLPSVLPFKRTQLTDRYPKGQTRGRHWKHLKQILQAENYHTYPADEPHCECGLLFPRVEIENGVVGFM